jgi:hypothetical protein
MNQLRQLSNLEKNLIYAFFEVYIISRRRVAIRRTVRSAIKLAIRRNIEAVRHIKIRIMRLIRHLSLVHRRHTATRKVISLLELAEVPTFNYRAINNGFYETDLVSYIDTEEDIPSTELFNLMRREMEIGLTFNDDNNMQSNVDDVMFEPLVPNNVEVRNEIEIEQQAENQLMINREVQIHIEPQDQDQDQDQAQDQAQAQDQDQDQAQDQAQAQDQEDIAVHDIINRYVDTDSESDSSSIRRVNLGIRPINLNDVVFRHMRVESSERSVDQIPSSYIREQEELEEEEKKEEEPEIEIVIEEAEEEAMIEIEAEEPEEFELNPQEVIPFDIRNPPLNLNTERSIMGRVYSIRNVRNERVTVTIAIQTPVMLGRQWDVYVSINIWPRDRIPNPDDIVNVVAFIGGHYTGTYITHNVIPNIPASQRNLEQNNMELPIEGMIDMREEEKQEEIVEEQKQEEIDINEDPDRPRDSRISYADIDTEFERNNLTFRHDNNVLTMRTFSCVVCLQNIPLEGTTDVTLKALVHTGPDTCNRIIGCGTCSQELIQRATERRLFERSTCVICNRSYRNSIRELPQYLEENPIQIPVISRWSRYLSRLERDYNIRTIEQIYILARSRSTFKFKSIKCSQCKCTYPFERNINDVRYGVYCMNEIPRFKCASCIQISSSITCTSCSMNLIPYNILSLNDLNMINNVIQDYDYALVLQRFDQPINNIVVPIQRRRRYTLADLEREYNNYYS